MNFLIDRQFVALLNQLLGEELVDLLRQLLEEVITWEQNGCENFGAHEIHVAVEHHDDTDCIHAVVKKSTNVYIDSVKVTLEAIFMRQFRGR